MGYRLHYAQHYAPKWEGGYFNWGSDKFADLVRGEFENNHWLNDDDTECELERADIEAYIKKLMAAPSDINPYFADGDADGQYTNLEVAEVFKEILQSDDDTIHMEWF